jgi:hypothetical protein
MTFRCKVTIQILVGLVAICLADVFAQQARAGYMIGLASNYGLLYEGNNNQQLQFNGATLNGNMGIGAGVTGTSGQLQASSGTIFGAVSFSASKSGQFQPGSFPTFVLSPSNANTPAYSDPTVTTALNTMNSLSQSMGTEAGTAVGINTPNGVTETISASNGLTDSSGNLVFTVTGVSTVNGGTLTINGNSSQYVVLNIAASADGNFNGTINLTGGITPDHVLFNLTPNPTDPNYASDYATLMHGPTFQTSGNMNVMDGIFLDPTGTVSVDNTSIFGRVIGGDTQNFSFVSGSKLTAPAAVPEPGTIALLSPFAACALCVWRLRRKKK